MKIFAIDTSSLAASCAVWEDDWLKGEFFINTKMTHSQTILPMVQNLLNSTGLTLNEMDLFAVSCGPGSFTGLRIGISAVKGMAYGLQKPCAAVSTLEALASNLLCSDALVCPVMDARRDQFYTALFEMKGGKMTRLWQDQALTSPQLAAQLMNLEKNIIFVGDGARLCYNKLNKTVSGLSVAPDALLHQKASSVGFIARQLAEQNQLVSPSELMPVYLRLPQAERELLEKQGGGKKE